MEENPWFSNSILPLGELKISPSVKQRTVTLTTSKDYTYRNIRSDITAMLSVAKIKEVDLQQRTIFGGTGKPSIQPKGMTYSPVSL